MTGTYGPMTEEETAFEAWAWQRAYIDGRGNYHVRRPWRSSGPIAPWNRTIKRDYPTVTAFHRAARAWVEHLRTR